MIKTVCVLHAWSTCGLFGPRRVYAELDQLFWIHSTHLRSRTDGGRCKNCCYLQTCQNKNSQFIVVGMSE